MAAVECATVLDCLRHRFIAKGKPRFGGAFLCLENEKGGLSAPFLIQLYLGSVKARDVKLRRSGSAAALQDAGDTATVEDQHSY
jgi:hypothetical protein